MTNPPRNKVRIIGGQWRSRQITFPDLPGLRPTADRIRETLFNWLAPKIEGARCLDLFAGSGALGFEALSRGAAQVTFVDQARQVIDALKKNAQSLQTTQAEFILGAFPKILEIIKGPFDVIFLDPPFYQNLIQPAAQLIEDKKLLVSGGLIYIETEKDLKPLLLPPHWQILKEKQTSTLSYYLCKN